mmetsp:Transcript_39184/g.106032  ORF Transcript_39184/g.106032 Transcript_39184/m.106032 type:complete len:362 (-) Transcript_39184:233-1318(-)
MQSNACCKSLHYCVASPAAAQDLGRNGGRGARMTPCAGFVPNACLSLSELPAHQSSLPPRPSEEDERDLAEGRLPQRVAVHGEHRHQVGEEAQRVEDEGQELQVAREVHRHGREPASDDRAPDRAGEPDRVLHEEGSGGAKAVADGGEDREADRKALGLLMVDEVVDDLRHRHEHEEVGSQPTTDPAHQGHEPRRPRNQEHKHDGHADEARHAEDHVVVGHGGRADEGEERAEADGGRRLRPHREGPRGEAPHGLEQGDHQADADDGQEDEEGHRWAVARVPNLRHHHEVRNRADGLHAHGRPLALAGKVGAEHEVAQRAGGGALPREAREVGGIIGLEVLHNLRHLQRQVGEGRQVDREL